MLARVLAREANGLDSLPLPPTLLAPSAMPRDRSCNTVPAQAREGLAAVIGTSSSDEEDEDTTAGACKGHINQHQCLS